jgi:hypothetical protein
VLICGTFNKWNPEMMEKYTEEEIEQDPTKEGTFVYRRKLLRGFKYRFNFILDNSQEPVVDEN